MEIIGEIIFVIQGYLNAYEFAASHQLMVLLFGRSFSQLFYS